MTDSNRSLRRAVRFTLAASAISASVPMAHAQQAAPSPAPAVVEEVVVTGSRIAQAPNDVSISPVTSITSIDIQQTGLVRVEDLLNNLPQVIAENSSGQSISSNGTATVSLRGLGSQRTLVLVNGRRMAPGGGLGSSGAADIDQIPADLIERADILTGGASAVYGADAVAGVVNFVLDTHYDGVRLDANYAFGQHSNDWAGPIAALNAHNFPAPSGTVNVGQTKSMSFLAGSNFADGKGNATVYATYLNAAPIAGYQIDYAACTLNQPGSDPTQPYVCGGSSTSAYGKIKETGQTPGGAPMTPVGYHAIDPVTGAIRPYHGATDAYNYGALSYLQRQQERWTAGAFFSYDLNPNVSAYAETMYARNTSKAQFGPSGEFAYADVVVGCNNAEFTAAELALFCDPATVALNNQKYPTNPPGTVTLTLARRSVESGGRIDNFTNDSIRQVLGTKGKLNDAWTYDVYGQVSINTTIDQEDGYLNTQRISNALYIVPGPGGVPTCESVVNGTDPTCAPWDIFNAHGGVSAASLNYLVGPASYQVISKEYIGDASATGDFGKYGVKLPSAASGLQVNFGAEWREEKFDFNPDFIFGNGFNGGGNGAFLPIHGQFRVSEVFTEFHLPLIDEKPGAYALALEGGYRYSSYSQGFSTNTYKFGVEYAPIQSLRIRGSYNRAVRAPDLQELYNPPVIGAGGTSDPCWGTTPTYTAAQCARTGVSAAQYGNIEVNTAAQINTSGGGNTRLVPEVADTYTLGFVFQPSVIPGLVVSVDYYDIKLKQTIATLSSNTVLADCGVANLAGSCALIHRDPVTGSLWTSNNDFVNTNFLNIGALTVKGIDLSSHYQLEIGSAGKLAFNLSGSYIQKWLTQPDPTASAYDCTGYMGSTCNAPTPKWRHVLNSVWAAPWAGLSVNLRWRYIGGTASDRTSPDPALNSAYYAPTAFIPAYNYFDISASAPISSTFSLRLGVNNIADKRPPLILNGTYSDCPTAGCNDNTWVGTYDTLGRYIYAHLSAKF